MTDLVHQLVGYDRETEMVAYERDFRPDEWDKIRGLLRPDDDDPSMVCVYPVDRATVTEITAAIRAEPPSDLDYFIECSAGDDPSALQNSSEDNASFDASFAETGGNGFADDDEIPAARGKHGL